MRQSMSDALSNVTGVARRKGIVYASAAVTLGAHERHCRATTTSAGAAFTVTLPAPEDVPGAFFHIWMVARNGTKDVTIAGGNQGVDIVLNLAGENVVLMSTGVTWVGVYANGPTVP